MTKFIDTKIHEIASRFWIDGRMDRMTENQEFLSLTDHKENFLNNPNRYSEMGRRTYH